MKPQGWRGVLEQGKGSPEPALFRSIPGAVFPLYHVLADFGEFAGGAVIPAKSSDPLRIDGVVLHKDHKNRLLLANLSPKASNRQGELLWPRRCACACLMSGMLRKR